MRRRSAIGALGLTAVAPRLATAQSGERPARIAVYMDVPADDTRASVRLAAFAQGLQETGRVIGRNIRIDHRWRVAGDEQLQVGARALVAAAPAVILASSSPVVAALQRETRTIPIVFVAVIDPVGAGFVESFARPGGNITGFTSIDYDVAGKWLEILREVDPALRRVAMLDDPSVPSTRGQVAVAESAASALGLALTRLDVRDIDAVERALGDFAQLPHAGVVVAASSAAGAGRDRLIAAMARLRLPAVYPYDHFAPAGGLIAYGPDLVDPFRRAADYVDRVLRGARPAELPVQAPNRLELIVNLRTARELGIAVPQTLLLRADEVIE
ncbi:MAG: ABC transporter substrate-binding protein [Alphaproteobacteria bacterium]|nr:ABC transporter substrate-binding protein [Alphaproteobacteria bacterium]